MIFGSFPENWQKQYIRAGKNITMDSLADIIQFMSNEKAFADNDDKKRKAKEQGSKGDNNKKKKTSNYKNNNSHSIPYQLREMYRNTPFDAPCPQHGPSHTSGQCRANPFSRTGGGNQQGRNQGRGYGRGGGRGNFRGRGGRQNHFYGGRGNGAGYVNPGAHGQNPTGQNQQYYYSYHNQFQGPGVPVNPSQAVPAPPPNNNNNNQQPGWHHESHHLDNVGYGYGAYRQGQYGQNGGVPRGPP